MKIVEKFKTGVLKGWTIRKSKYGWYDIYSNGGGSQTCRQNTLEEIKKIVKDKTIAYKA